MFSFTGFSATTDLPENSTVMEADFDVGSITLVENVMVKVFTNAIIWDTTHKTPYFFLERIEDSRIYSKEDSKGQTYTQDIEQPPGNYTFDFELYNARGSLTK